MPMLCGHSFFMQGNNGLCVLCENERICKEINENLTKATESLRRINEDLSFVADHLSKKPKRDGLK